MRRLLAIVATAIVLLLGFAVPAAAQDSSTPSAGAIVPLAGVCGGGYSHVGHYAVGASPALGYMDVYWSRTARRNCLVVSHSSATWGASMFTQARIRPSGYSWPRCPSSTGCDAGFFRYYAGPVYTPSGVNMSRRCIDIQGAVDWSSASRTRIHCG